MLITSSDLVRYNSAAKMIEDDAGEAYFAVRQKYGADVAGSLLVLFLRLALNPQKQWPPSDDITDKVVAILKEHKLIEW